MHKKNVCSKTRSNSKTSKSKKSEQMSWFFGKSGHAFSIEASGCAAISTT